MDQRAAALAREVAAATAALNQAVQAATSAGLVVTVHQAEVQAVGQDPRPHLTVMTLLRL